MELALWWLRTRSESCLIPCFRCISGAIAEVVRGWPSAITYAQRPSGETSNLWACLYNITSPYITVSWRPTKRPRVRVPRTVNCLGVFAGCHVTWNQRSGPCCWVVGKRRSTRGGRPQVLRSRLDKKKYFSTWRGFRD